MFLLNQLTVSCKHHDISFLNTLVLSPKNMDVIHLSHSRNWTLIWHCSAIYSLYSTISACFQWPFSLAEYSGPNLVLWALCLAVSLSVSSALKQTPQCHFRTFTTLTFLMSPGNIFLKCPSIWICLIVFPPLYLQSKYFGRNGTQVMLCPSRCYIMCQVLPLLMKASFITWLIWYQPDFLYCEQILVSF